MSEDEVFTEDDLLAEIRQYLDAPDDTSEREAGTITTAELAELMETTQRRALMKAKQLCGQGILAPEYVYRTNLWGRSIPRPGFRYIGGDHAAHTKTS